MVNTIKKQLPVKRAAVVKAISKGLNSGRKLRLKINFNPANQRYVFSERYKNLCEMLFRHDNR